MNASFKFRPHHFLCTLGFAGKGYSSAFVDNFQMISDHLKDAGDDTLIEVVAITDSICAACPHQEGAYCGSNQDFILALDARHAHVLKLNTGDKITWGQAKKRIVSHMDEATFEKTCKGCPWQDLGLCLAALKDLRQKSF